MAVDGFRPGEKVYGATPGDTAETFFKRALRFAKEHGSIQVSYNGKLILKVEPNSELQALLELFHETRAQATHDDDLRVSEAREAVKTTRAYLEGVLRAIHVEELNRIDAGNVAEVLCWIDDFFQLNEYRGDHEMHISLAAILNSKLNEVSFPDDSAGQKATTIVADFLRCLPDYYGGNPYATRAVASALDAWETNYGLKDRLVRLPNPK